MLAKADKTMDGRLMIPGEQGIRALLAPLARCPSSLSPTNGVFT